ncbi:sugar phosphate isomerase/epimerase family protein [Algoriphagus vanfongensis]|uniref:sugar phosphate isomerase/epimerase family protein n=1 Tax=Algoriphagus vanfongensis TaxID=426371 RepID=UPI00040F68E6|nr:sugar phosphate isomerase/epimerase family protein [Algoriphagus vanfongensis]
MFRKKFLLLSVFLCIATTSLLFPAKAQQNLPELGVVSDYENGGILKQVGFQWLVESTSRMLSPIKYSEEEFAKNLEEINKSELPILAFNILIPGELKVVGPEVDQRAVLDYLEVVFLRGKRAGVSLFIWGSGGSRRVPEGFDHQVARKQFSSMAKEVAQLAARHDVVLALESLNSSETNFINTLEEALAIVQEVDHPNFRLCVDIYHMLREEEGPGVIHDAKGYVVYCEVAEKADRTAPGVVGEDFVPYFEALHQIGYSGKIMIECRWNDLSGQAESAYDYLYEQVRIGFGN